MIIFVIFEIKHTKNGKIQIQTNQIILFSNWKFAGFHTNFSDCFWYCFRNLVFCCFDKLGEQNKQRK